MTIAITDDVIISVRIASFYPLNKEAKNNVVSKISETMVELGHKHNFIVYKTSMESRMEKNI